MHRFLPLLVLVLLATGCGEEGPVGPAGPPGDDGNANVQSFSFTYDDASCTNMNLFVTCRRTWNAITPNVMREGAVFAYLRNSDGTYTSLPLTTRVDLDGDGTYESRLEYRFTYGLGLVELGISLGGQTVDTIGTGEVRVVAIAGGSGFAKNGTPPPYAALARRYGLPLD